MTAHADVTSFSYVSVLSDRGDYVGRGEPFDAWAPGGGTVVVNGDSHQMVIGASGSGSTSYRLTFAAPDSQPLAVGDYSGAQKASSAAAGKPGMDVDGFAACNVLSGEFSISDIHFSDSGIVDRLRLQFQESCPGEIGGLSGVVALNETPTDPAAVTAPEAVVFPPTYVNSTSATADVRLVNEQTTPLTVSSVAFTGTDAAKFNVLSNSCSSAPVPAGGSCLATINFSPGADRADAAAALTFTDDSVAGSHTVPVSGVVQSGYTSWDLAGDRDDTVLGPISVKDAPSPTAKVAVRATSNSLTVQMFSVRPYPYGETMYTATFTVPDGQSLAVGDYPSATTTGSTSGPGLNLDNPWSQCVSRTDTGSFDISELSVDPDTGSPTALSLTFETHCTGNPAAAYGSISWHATNPAADRAGPGSVSDTTPPAATGGGASGGQGYLYIGWQNPPDVDWDHTVVREAAGLTPPASPIAGVNVYSGRASSVIVRGLTPGQSYSYSIWSEDTRGNWSVGSKVVVHGTVVLLGLPKAAPYGQPFYAVAEAVDVVTGKVLPNVRISFGARYPGSATWFGGSVGTDAKGIAQFPFILKHSAYIHAVFQGDYMVTGSSSSTPLELLSPGLQGTFLGSLKPGGTEKISGTIFPNLAGQRIYLQRHSGGVWYTSRSMLLSSRSTFSFAFSLGAGTFTFRLYMPAVRGFQPLYSESLVVIVR